MARPKQFDRDAALDRAIAHFADFGFEGSSTDELLSAMNLSRQSLYDTFGSKSELYLEALRRYNEASAARIVKDISIGPTPMAGIRTALTSFIDGIGQGDPSTCLGVGAIAEFGDREPRIAAVSQRATDMLIAELTKAFAQAQDEGELREGISPEVAAAYFLSTHAGLKLSARAGASVPLLHRIGALALDALTGKLAHQAIEPSRLPSENQ